MGVSAKLIARAGRELPKSCGGSPYGVLAAPVSAKFFA